MMPLFGPNIKKMKENGDVVGLTKLLPGSNLKNAIEATKALGQLKHVEGLAEALKSRNAEVRLVAAQALKNIKDDRALDVLSKALADSLRFGEFQDQLEALVIIQGRLNKWLSVALPYGDSKLIDVSKEVGGRMGLRFVQSVLDEVRKQRKVAVGCCAAITLIELGDRRDDVLEDLITFGQSWADSLNSQMAAGEGALTAFFVAEYVLEETVRALAHFKGNKTANTAILGVFEGKLLSGSHLPDASNRKNAIALWVLWVNQLRVTV